MTPISAATAFAQQRKSATTLVRAPAGSSSKRRCRSTPKPGTGFEWLLAETTLIQSSSYRTCWTDSQGKRTEPLALMNLAPWRAPPGAQRVSSVVAKQSRISLTVGMIPPHASTVNVFCDSFTG